MIRRALLFVIVKEHLQGFNCEFLQVLYMLIAESTRWTVPEGWS